jgi:hypothetical protein
LLVVARAVLRFDERADLHRSIIPESPPTPRRGTFDPE